MFYSQFILAKKGPLGTIWIAAHLERKLRKNQVADTDIGVSVDSILFPEVPIALRLSSHLLLGVVRIYSRKVGYLFDDCSEALLKIKQAFRSTAVDLPPEESKAPYHSITLPETFDLDDFELPDTEIFQGNFVDHHVSTKEQITLQDTMDGVVYSTSQFGLDERFGDGDTSQIGLDPDEELLLNKGTSQGHLVLLSSRTDPQTSFEPSSIQKGDEEMHETSHAAATNSSIEAPSTPGLVEGLNLPSAEEALVSGDHMEEDHNPTDLSAKEIGAGAPSQPFLDHVEDTINQAAVQENGCVSGNKEIEKSPASTEPMELLVLSNNAHISGSGDVFEASKGLHIENGHNGSLSKSELLGAFALQYNGECGEDQAIGLTESTTPLIASHKSTSLSEQLDHFPYNRAGDKSSVNGLHSSVCESASDVDKLSLEPAICNNTVSEGKVQPNVNSELENTVCQGVMRHEEPEISNADANKNMLYAGNPVLQASNLLTNEANTELGNVVYQHGREDAPDTSDDKLQGRILNEGNLPDVVTCDEFDGHSEMLRVSQLEKGNDSAAFDLPSPERMLSLPDMPLGQPNELLMGSTPEREVLVGGDQNTVNKISGKKRSFAESTITLQSLNSVESSEAAQSKRSADFIPDDDDLLSSILVGRRSTALKVKSTPPAFDLASSKRPRVAARSAGHKRKVLVDDSMVLHGDIIREQLLNTEDIRRVRKKAPSTLPEIWILQKQFLEDEIFNESVFTGMSTELISLHCQPFDLSRIEVIQDDGGKAKSTEVEITGSPITPIVGEEATFEGTSALLVARDGNSQQSAECLSETPVQSSVKVLSESGDNTLDNERIIHNEAGCTPLQSDHSENRALVEMDCRREHTGEEADHSVACGKDAIHIEDASVVEMTCLEGVDTTAGDQDILEYRIEEGNLVGRVENFDSAVHTEGTQLGCSLPVSEDIIAEEELQMTSKVTDQGTTDEPEIVHKDEIFESDLKYDDRGSILDHVNSLNIDWSSSVGRDSGPGSAVMAEGMSLENHCAEPQIYDAATTAPDHPALENIEDLGADAIEHDTDFLNFDDDDEIAEEEDNSMPNVEGSQSLENIGWSSRTRAVANYLQVLFQKESEHGRKLLHLDNLLANKSRKEASRMFFETLVLKTRDYIHVEQEDPFACVSVKPRVKLLKSQF